MNVKTLEERVAKARENVEKRKATIERHMTAIRTKNGIVIGTKGKAKVETIGAGDGIYNASTTERW